MEKGVVRLNVGGSGFETSRETLECSGVSYFRRVVEDCSEEKVVSVFIDRDPRHFHRILNYFRSGKMVLPDSPSDVEELLIECDFYGIEEAVPLLSEEKKRKTTLGDVVDAVRGFRNDVKRRM